MILDNFKSWKASEQPELLKNRLPVLAAIELKKLRSLKG